MIIYGHRGNEKDYIENTMESIINCNYEGIEIDVRLTKDKVIILHHDDNYKRIYGFDYKVNKVNYNIALFFCKKIVTIQKVLEYAKEKNKKLIVDIKEEKENNIKYIIKNIYYICERLGYNINNIIFLCWHNIIKPYDDIKFFKVIDGDSLIYNNIVYNKDILGVDGICLEYTGTLDNTETIEMIKTHNLLVSVYSKLSIDDILVNKNIDYITI
jgi:glycerophosphoryl diester phosphodiesterase